MNNDLGTRLFRYRSQNRFTQAQVASSVGITRQRYSNYETGRRTPPPVILSRLADLYQVTVDQLIGMAKPELYCLNSREIFLISTFRILTDSKRQELISYTSYLKDQVCPEYSVSSLS